MCILFAGQNLTAPRLKSSSAFLNPSLTGYNELNTSKKLSFVVCFVYHNLTKQSVGIKQLIGW